MPREEVLPSLDPAASRAAQARFHHGQQLYLATFCYASTSVPERTLFSHSAYYGLEPGSDLGLRRVEFSRATINGHYLVHGAQDGPNDKPRYHGFLLEADNGDLWVNQYPKATHVQKDNTGADYHFANISGGVPGVRRRAVELTHVLRSLDEGIAARCYTDGMKQTLEQRRRATMLAFHDTYPEKVLVQGEVDVAGQSVTGYFVSERHPAERSPSSMRAVHPDSSAQPEPRA